MVLTNALGVRKVREIWSRITRQLDLWDRVIHIGLVWDSLAEGRAQDGRVKRCVEEEEDSLARISHINVLSGKLHQAVYWAMNRKEGGGVPSHEERLQEDRATGCRCPLVETP